MPSTATFIDADLPMRTPSGKRITLLIAIAVIAVSGATLGVLRRDIYYALWPNARFLDADPEVRLAAADDWEEARLSEDPRVQARFEATRDEVIAALIRALGDAPEVAEAAVDSLAVLRIAEDDVFDAFFSVLRHDGAAVRLGALRGLEGLHGRGFSNRYRGRIPELAERLDDDDHRIRALTLTVLANTCEAAGHPNTMAVEGLYGRLVAATRDASADVRESAVKMFGRVPWQRPASVVRPLLDALRDPSGPVRREAALALKVARHDDAAQRALPSLRDALGDPEFEVRFAAARTMWEIGTDPQTILPVVAEAFDHLEGLDLALPARIACESGPVARAAVPGLIRTLGKIESARHLTSGSEVLEALCSIGPGPDVALPLLRKALRSDHLATRGQAVLAVATLYGDAQELADFLLDRPRDGELESEVIHALVTLGRLGANVADRIAESLQSRGEWLREYAADGLAELGLRAAPALPQLLTVLDDAKPDVRAAAARALGKIGGEAVVQALVERLDRIDAALPALSDCGHDAKLALPAVLARLDRRPGEVARVLLALEPEVAAGALPDLERALRIASGRDRVLVAEAIVHHGGDVEIAVAVLVESLASQDDEVVEAAAYALGRLGPRAKAAVPKLREATKHHDWEVNAAAGAALFQVAGDAGTALAAISQSVRNTSPPSERGVRAVGLLGPAGKSYVADLVEAALHWREEYWKNEDRTHAAIESLGRIGPDAREALPVLRELERNVLFRLSAREAIERIAGATH